MDRPSFVIELAADASFAKDLAAGGVFIPARALKVYDELDLVVRGGAGELLLAARVVYIDPQRGAGLELIGFGPALKEQLAQLAQTPLELAVVKTVSSQKRARVLTTRPAPGALDDSDEAPTARRGGSAEETAHEGAWEAEPPNDDDTVEEEEITGRGGLAADIAERKKLALNAAERLRGLSLAQQIKVARGPSATDRMQLERMYNKNVWEALLHNPGLTAPEVSRLARLGTLPRVLLELIVGNNTWMQIPEVRRALLANPRLGVDQVTRVLRFLPKHELKLAATIPAYPHAVRSIAKRMVDD